ncbi:SnoaL-like domain-containing protein [Catalinimonas alkaloidigena]|uniref:SnoaL-like domain-containing protein n=1 Tax=Catalinimonas alkaloidigena TaxID=1075417 RepID=A0A1G9M2J6_9BACT|nr:nuclear transport factor 2 family protein [Catalinimonas alkaloidigena]SDL68333.1 SnoaL-like domain-containing protein [Catalinimonas alkaloidigena]
MATQLADQFIEALQKLESDHDVDTIVSLFADDCEVGNLVSNEKFHGTDEARKFWTHYRETFGDVHSTFQNKIINDHTVALEWTTEGDNGKGQDVSYRGVSILETNGDKVVRFFAYFDPKALGQQVQQA